METELHHLPVPRTARFFTAGPLREWVEDVWFVFHGYGELASEFLGYCRALYDPGRLLIAPEGLSRFYHQDHERVGASWMTREDRLHEMEDYVRYLDLVHHQIFSVVEPDQARLTLLGFSQGAATAARWAVRGQARIDRLILWGSALPPELDDDEAAREALRTVGVLLVAGSRDQYFTDESWEEERARLRRLNVPLIERHFEGGHRLDDDTLLELARTTR